MLVPRRVIDFWFQWLIQTPKGSLLERVQSPNGLLASFFATRMDENCYHELMKNERCSTKIGYLWIFEIQDPVMKGRHSWEFVRIYGASFDFQVFLIRICLFRCLVSLGGKKKHPIIEDSQHRGSH